MILIATAPCPSGYVRTPSGTCVNLLIDFNNCGSIGYVCGSSFTSCSYGVCSAAPAVMLPNAVAPSGWGGSASADDATIVVTVPFSISLYNVYTTTPTLQTNGVSISIVGEKRTNGVVLVLGHLFRWLFNFIF